MKQVALFVGLSLCAVGLVGCVSSKGKGGLPQRFEIPVTQVVVPPGKIIDPKTPCSVCGVPMDEHYFVRLPNGKVIPWRPELRHDYTAF